MQNSSLLLNPELYLQHYLEKEPAQPILTLLKLMKVQSWVNSTQEILSPVEINVVFKIVSE